MREEMEGRGGNGGRLGIRRALFAIRLETVRHAPSVSLAARPCAPAMAAVRASVWENPWVLLEPPAGAGEAPPARAGEELQPGLPEAAGARWCHAPAEAGVDAGASWRDPPAGAGVDAEGDEDPPARAGVAAPVPSNEELLARIAQRFDRARRQAGLRSLTPPRPPGPRPPLGPPPPALRQPMQGPAGAGLFVLPRGSVGRTILEKARPPPPRPVRAAFAPPFPLPAYFQQWDMGMRPKAVPELSGRPSNSARSAPSRSRSPVRAPVSTERPTPPFGYVGGTVWRRSERELEVKRIGAEALAEIFIQSGLEAANRVARERGLSS